MNLLRESEIYSADRKRRMIVLRRTDNRFHVSEERLRSYENSDEYRPTLVPFPFDGFLPEWSMVVDRRVEGLFGTVSDAEAEARRLLESDNNRYAGLTVNERLFEAGLLSDFDAAVAARNRQQMIHMLTDVAVEDAAGSVDAILQNPEWYGYK